MTSLHLSTHLRSDIINDYVFTQRWPVSMLTTGFKAVSFEIPITIAQNAIQFTPWMESIQIAFARMFIHRTVWNVWAWERDRLLFFYLWLFYTDLKKNPFIPLPFSHISHSTMNKHSWEKKKQCTPGDPFEQVTLIQSKLLADNTEWNIQYGINSILNSYTHTHARWITA